ncbi:hypothetical protein [Tellurirhabdus rosea]|uniref:hypothetical protein n=1 Tax=Tellurirhabdus rosea TaxID=2674997 RepID=UPI0022544D73|nr:hypothetical protein [Tellurirhabdus rosea]
MKTISAFVFALIFTVSFAFGQSDKYQKAMEKAVAQFDTARSAAAIQTSMNQFERIANAEKNQWLPYYYAGMCAMRMANRDDKTKIDFWAEKSDVFAAKADSVGGDKSEVLVLKSLNALARINVDFMSRGPQYVGQAMQLLQDARKANADNPRVPLILGQVKLSSPEGFGGDKAGGCQLIGQSLALFEKAPQGGTLPHWGKEDALRVQKKCGEMAGK